MADGVGHDDRKACDILRCPALAVKLRCPALILKEAKYSDLAGREVQGEGFN